VDKEGGGNIDIVE